MPAAPRADSGWIAPDVAEELPGLGLASFEGPCPVAARSPRWAKDHLRQLSTAIDGRDVLHMHQMTVPAAFRALFRALGRDPDHDRSPYEAACIERLARGGFRPGGLPDDALLIALVETGVPVWALDADAVDGTLGIRCSLSGEIPDPTDPGRPLPPGRLVVADERRALADLCRPPRAEVAVGRRTERAVFFAIRPPGVAAITVDEALWSCHALLAAG
ncbi:hypothetical protein PAI11_21590 [Patulibacter medicamentivorans]|uniref:B3/B4 tRNA-binding domain-containing protein n=1 Tax=Patulibacter medicamentivorans TaxID=1097667 RepID=H0E5R0_9ACTN|nr:hypothetical protein [Patulibacter medicamentivorans]EHN11023.1 hypothetical protein PAI11_21590 [Patulibacter medicamentivorans]